MAKLVQILLLKPLTVNLGVDENGQAKVVRLVAGLQEVDSEVAQNWFVKAHCQEITQSDVANLELEKAYADLKAQFDALQTQSDEATAKIEEKDQLIKDKDAEIADLKVQLDKALQSPSTTTDEKTKGK